LSSDIVDIAGAEAVGCAEGDMCGLVMREAVVLPESKTISRAKGDRRKLGDLLSGRAAASRAGPRREGEEP
jgi:hypothetical protein